MKQNYPTMDTIKKSGDRVAALLRSAAQPKQPGFANNVNAILQAGAAAATPGASPMAAFKGSLKDDENKVMAQQKSALTAEASVYDMLVKQRDQGSAEADKIMTVAEKLSNNDPVQMKRLIDEGFKRYPDGEITLTDAVNLAGELGIQPKKSSMDTLKEEYLQSQINKNNRTSVAGAVTPAMQTAQYKDQLKQSSDAKTRVESAQELLNKIQNLANVVQKTGGDQGPEYGMPIIGKAMRGTAALTGMQSEKHRKELEAQISQLQGLMSGMRKGQGAVSDYEREMYGKMGPQITNDAETNMAILQSLAEEAKNTINRYSGIMGGNTEAVPTGDSIDSTLGKTGAMAPLTRKPGQTLSEMAAGDNPDLGNIKNRYGLQ